LPGLSLTTFPRLVYLDRTRTPDLPYFTGVSYTDTVDPSNTIPRFDQFLTERGLSLNTVIIGETALHLLGVITRVTRDCDVLYPQIPPEIAKAAVEFAHIQREGGDDLAEKWFNTGTGSLTLDLPDGWQDRLQSIFKRQALEFQTLGRLDLLRSKLFALCDRGVDLPDCIALKPTPAELRTIAPWLRERDGNLQWPEHVDNVLADLQERLK
jgi:hypothetical protein